MRKITIRQIAGTALIALAGLLAGPVDILATAPDGDCATYVYVLDVSESMIGKCSNNKCTDVLEDVKTGLSEMVSRYIDLPTQVTVYTFYNQDSFLSKKSFSLSGPGPEVMRLVDYIHSLEVKPPETGKRRTHLYGALASILNDYPYNDQCPANFYLLTDGIDNSPNKEAKREAMLSGWQERSSDWLHYIDLYPGGNARVKKTCSDPDNSCSYHPVDARDREAVVNCFCIPSISFHPPLLDFGNLLLVPRPAPKLYVRREDSCLKSRRGDLAFRFGNAEVAGFPDASYAALIEPSRFPAEGTASLRIAFNRPVDDLPHGDYKGSVNLRANDLRYQIKPGGTLNFKFKITPPAVSVSLPARDLGGLRSPRLLPLQFDFSDAGEMGRITVELEAGAGVEEAIRSRAGNSA
ncbi:hypothetical protein ACFLU6_15245, partial [Acidobacteriota bacterium]